MYRCFDELDDGVIIFDQDNTVARLNRSFQETFGISGEAAHGTEIGDLITRHLAPLTREEGVADRMLEALRCRREVAHATCRMRTSTGAVRCGALVLLLVPGDVRRAVRRDGACPVPGRHTRT